MKPKWSFALVAGLLALVTLFAASAKANAPRVTQGDAQAILESSGAGGGQYACTLGAWKELRLTSSLTRLPESVPILPGKEGTSAPATGTSSP